MTTLNIKKIKKLYYKGMTQIEIAKKFNTTPQNICRYMKKNGIKARSAKEASSKTIKLSDKCVAKIWELYNAGFNRENIAKKLNITDWAARKTLEGNCRMRGESISLYNKLHSVPLTKNQKDLILGSLLGDASIVLRKNGGLAFSVGHCLEQKNYLYHKASVLNTKVRSYIKNRQSYSNGKKYFITAYHNHYELLKLVKFCFVNGIKKISKQWTNELNARSIAYWFMDDGTSSFRKNTKQPTAVRFSTLSFTKKELILLQKRLLDFNIKTTLQKHSDGCGFVIYVRINSVNTLFNLINPYIVPCMKYKIKKLK